MKVGMKTILIKTSKNSIDAHKVGADYVVTNLLEIKDLV
jgi:hypothetical protein